MQTNLFFIELVDGCHQHIQSILDRGILKLGSCRGSVAAAPSREASSCASFMAFSGEPEFTPTWRSSRPSMVLTAVRVSSVIFAQFFSFTASPGTIQEPPQQRILSKDR